MKEPLFRLDGEAVVPSLLTRGGWNDHAQHGSPPSGILARAIEMVPTVNPMQVLRYTIDMFREVPLTALTVETEVIREGRRVQLVEARLKSGAVDVARAVALKIRVTDLDTEITGNGPALEPPKPPPEELSGFDGPDVFGRDDRLVRFHTHAVEIRTIDGSFGRPIPGVSWFRLRHPLVEGEATTPFQRAATMADLANGNAQALDPRYWMFVNPDITLYLHRYPVGEWVAMTSSARQHVTGVGLTETTFFDRTGPFGTVNQAQLIERR